MPTRIRVHSRLVRGVADTTVLSHAHQKGRTSSQPKKPLLPPLPLRFKVYGFDFVFGAKVFSLLRNGIRSATASDEGFRRYLRGLSRLRGLRRFYEIGSAVAVFPLRWMLLVAATSRSDSSTPVPPQSKPAQSGVAAI